MSNRTQQLFESLHWLEGKTIAFVGDSITADLRWNYVTLFVDRLADLANVRSVKVVNAGVDSSSVADALDRLPDMLLEHDPDVVAVFLGINDSKIFRHTDRPLIGIEEFSAIYGALLDHLDALRNRHKVIANLPPLLFDDIRSGELLRDYWYWSETSYDAYNMAIARLAETKECSLADVATRFREADCALSELFVEDGVHPNLFGHRLIAEAMASAVAEVRR
jgi:lysophospholipase L1-like esterase